MLKRIIIFLFVCSSSAFADNESFSFRDFNLVVGDGIQTLYVLNGECFGERITNFDSFHDGPGITSFTLCDGTVVEFEIGPDGPTLLPGEGEETFVDLVSWDGRFVEATVTVPNADAFTDNMGYSVESNTIELDLEILFGTGVIQIPTDYRAGSGYPDGIAEFFDEDDFPRPQIYVVDLDTLEQSDIADGLLDNAIELDIDPVDPYSSERLSPQNVICPLYRYKFLYEIELPGPGNYMVVTQFDKEDGFVVNPDSLISHLTAQHDNTIFSIFNADGAIATSEPAKRSFSAPTYIRVYPEEDEAEDEETVRPVIGAFLTPWIDTDFDYLPDDWEQNLFADLSFDGTSDEDSDGLDNFTELFRGLNALELDRVRVIVDSLYYRENLNLEVNVSWIGDNWFPRGQEISWSMRRIAQYSPSSDIFLYIKKITQNGLPIYASDQQTEIGLFDSGEPAIFIDFVSNGSQRFVIEWDVINGDNDGMNGVWELNAGLDPFDSSDAVLDLDEDGLTNLEEFQTGTDPNYWDTDFDLIADVDEFNSIFLNPLVPDELIGVDFDNDGLDTATEFLYGTNPDLADSDFDGYDDNDELLGGGDPTSNTSKPFVPGEYNGPDVSDLDCGDIGDVGLDYSFGGGYTIGGYIGDPSGSESERWSLNIGNQSATSQGFGSVYNYSLVLAGGQIYEITLEHIASEQNRFDYDYVSNVEANGFLVIDPDSLLTPPLSEDGKNASDVSEWLRANPDYFNDDVPESEWSTKSAYLIPIASTSWSESYSGRDSVGPRYRKIALNGRPIPDEKPQEEDEKDLENEETYIDAFDLSLRHDTSYVYVPLASSELVLSVTASASELSWTDRSGLRPHERLTLPFGAGWSSNICSYVEQVESLGSGVMTAPMSVNVVDENGHSQRFGIDSDDAFFPWPSSLVDAKTYENRLERSGDNLVLYKKYGNTLTYAKCDAWFHYSSNRVDGGDSTKKHTYWRLVQVEDRFGNILNYDYGGSSVSLIPTSISSPEFPGQSISIARSDDCRRIDSITDPRGNTIEFNYLTEKEFVEYDVTKLMSVDYPDGTSKQYDYGFAEDSDAEINPDSPTSFYHGNITSITDKRENTYTFEYEPNETIKSYSASGGSAVYVPVSTNHLPLNAQAEINQQLEDINGDDGSSSQSDYNKTYGLPRLVKKVTLPGNRQSEFSKGNTSLEFGPRFTATNVETIIEDTEGNYTIYSFQDVSGEIIDKNITYGDSSTGTSSEWLLYYETMEVSYYGGAHSNETPIGTETFTFDPDSGLSLESIEDFSGNTTEWEFQNSRGASAGSRITTTNFPNMMSKWSDPTIMTDALGRVTTYQYTGDYRIMSKIVDEHGTRTEYDIDSLGRRTDKIVEDSSGVKLSQEDYFFTNSGFPKFMTRKKVDAYANISGQAWETDLVTEYVADSNGRIFREIVDPEGLALTTSYLYDNNGNRTSATDPRNNTTTFTYDKLNRLVKVTYPSAGTLNGERVTFVRYIYDYSGNLTLEIDEEGHHTMHHYDELGRKIRTIVDMDGLGLPSIPFEFEPQILADDNRGEITEADIVTSYTYNDVNSLTSVTDPRGIVTRNFYDDIQRVVHTYTNYEGTAVDGNGEEINGNPTISGSSERTHTEYVYDNFRNPGASAFGSEGFKPTQIIQHDAYRTFLDTETFSTIIVYDEVYREESTTVEYVSGVSALTSTDYGDIVGEKESLISTARDPLGKVVQTTRDGLGRVVEVRDAFGDPLETLTTTSYSSTGLAYQVMDPRGNRTETEYDAAGRPVKVWQTDPLSLVGAIDRQPADDTLIGSPVTETIYDAASNISATINPRGFRWNYTYDARNRQISERAPAVVDYSNPAEPIVWPTTITDYDGVGNVIGTTDPRGLSTVITFDNANRPTTTTTSAVPVFGEVSAQALVTSTTYDKNSNIKTVTDSEDNVTVNFYDALNRLTSTVTNPTTGQPSIVEGTLNTDDILVSYQYDDTGNQTRVTDGKGAVTEFRYDGLSRKTHTIWDSGQELERTHESHYNALLMYGRTDEKAQYTAYEYDDLNRLKNVRFTGRAIDDRDYAYDPNGNILSVTYPNEVDSIRAVASTYDPLNRLQTETSAGITHTYIYDKAGNRRSTTYGESSRLLTSTYDVLNRLETLTDGTRETEYQYNPAGDIVRKTLPNGVIIECVYDILGRKENATNTAPSALQPFAEYRYAYDAVSNIRQIEEFYPLGNLTDRVITNTYDRTYRLDSEEIAISGGTTNLTEYDYDDAHNRSAKRTYTDTVLDTTTTYTFGDGSSASTANSNQLITLSDGTQIISYTYDANGNRSSRSDGTHTDTYSYDYDNRLITLDYQTGTADTGSYAYAYDQRLRRVVRDESAISGRDLTILSFSGGTSVQEHTTTVSSSPEVEYIRGSDYGGGIGGILYTLRSDTPAFNHYNSRGDVVAKTDPLGAIGWQAQYEAFGKRTAEIGTNTDRQRANTKDEDPTGLLNEGFRYRDLEAGVFITRDPLGFVDGPNVYTYVVQNPWTMFDPTGLRKDDPPGVKPTDHHVVTRAKLREMHGTDNWNQHLTDALEDMKVPAGKPRGMPRHGWSNAHEVYDKRSSEIVDQVLELVKKDGVDIGGLSAKKSKELASMLVDQINSDPYNKQFNEMVGKGANTTGLNEMLDDFGGKNKMMKLQTGLNPKLFNKRGGMFNKMGGKLARKLGPLSAAAFFVVDLQAEGLAGATENAVKSATFYDVTVEPVGNAYSDTFQSIRNNSKYGTFDTDTENPTANAIGAAMNARKRAFEGR
ncbi:MAG: RHS repeat-associated core domain-containing protein [Verrucomicrobiota bacterium]